MAALDDLLIKIATARVTSASAHQVGRQAHRIWQEQADQAIVAGLRGVAQQLHQVQAMVEEAIRTIGGLPAPLAAAEQTVNSVIEEPTVEAIETGMQRITQLAANIDALCKAAGFAVDGALHLGNQTLGQLQEPLVRPLLTLRVILECIRDHGRGIADSAQLAVRDAQRLRA